MKVATDQFRSEMGIVRFEAGQVIFKEGEVGKAMYVVLEGEVALSIRGEEVERVSPGGVFGEMALIDRSPRTATAVALKGCKLVSIAEQRFMTMVQQTPKFSLQIMRVMADRLRRMNTRV